MYQSSDPAFQPELAHTLHAWLARNRYVWSMRYDEDSAYYLSHYALTPRFATVDEVADLLLADPAVHAALAVLSSPTAHTIELAVAREYLRPVEAQLLVSALQRAATIAIDERRPAWQRRDALGVVALAVAAAVAVAMLASAMRTGHKAS